MENTFKNFVKQETKLNNFCSENRKSKSEKLRQQLFNLFIRTDGIVIKPVISVRGKYHFKILFIPFPFVLQVNNY